MFPQLEKIRLGEKTEPVLLCILAAIVAGIVHLTAPWKGFANFILCLLFGSWAALVAIGLLLRTTHGDVDHTRVRFWRPWGWREAAWGEVETVEMDKWDVDVIVFKLRRGTRWTRDLRFRESLFLSDSRAADAEIDRETLVKRCRALCGNRTSKTR